MRNYQFIFVGLFLIANVIGSCRPTHNKLEQEKAVLSQANDTASRIKKLIGDASTVVICVRHAEKQSEGNNPSLTPEGHQRAQQLSEIFDDIKIDAILSTDYNRTQETVRPLSDRKNVDVTLYNSRDLKAFAADIKKNYIGKYTLISGHSNSTPQFINAMMGKKELKEIAHEDYDNMYVAILNNDGEITELHIIQYGAESVLH
jgi:broad specificity phosphatase PhoE